MALPLSASGFRSVEVLVIDDDPRSMDLVVEALISCGVNRATRALTPGEAHLHLGDRPFDVILMECDLRGEDAFALTRQIRSAPGTPNAASPIVMLSTSTPMSRVLQARDVGANFTLAKPVSPLVLQDRLLWIARQERRFIDMDTYRGPDRRIRSGPLPQGVGERRQDALRLTAAPERELSQDEINNLFN
jgi:CheY-like chemotaxis protein